MKIALCILFGYLIGTLSPSALVSKVKKKNLRKNGTGNLGATNVMLNFGKAYGVLVMLFDIFKAFITVKLASHLFPTDNIIPLIAGTAVVVGHIYPFYMKFKGGKGLAAFGGLVLAYDAPVFLLLLLLGIALMLILNYAVFIPVSAAALFPVFVGLHTYSLPAVAAALIAGIILITAHIDNLSAAFSGTAPKIRDYLKNDFISK